MCSNLFDNVSKMGEASLKDDFAAAANYEWAKIQEEDRALGVGGSVDARKIILKNKRALIDDKSVQGKNIELIRTADGLFCDWNYRNSLGVEPLKKYLGFIDQIKSLDDVSSYMIDNDKNPFALTLVELDSLTNDNVDDYQVLIIRRAEFTLGDWEYYLKFSDQAAVKKDQVQKQLVYILGRCGYTDKEIKNVISGCFRFESELAHVDSEDPYPCKDICSNEDIIKLAGNYPFEAMLKHYSITKCEHYFGYTTYLKNLRNIYTQKNVEDMKSYFKALLALKSIAYLDKDAYDCSLDSAVDRTDSFSERRTINPEEEFFECIRKTPLTAAIDQAYLDKYYDESVYNEVSGFLSKIKEIYVTLIDSNTRLSEKSKAAVKDKLSKIDENVIKPDNTADFTGVTLKSREEGGSFLDALCVLNKIRYEHLGEMVQNKTGRSYWDIYDGQRSTTRVEAFYSPQQNCIYILMGALTAPMYSADYTIEQKLGAFGVILAHEISHAFDDFGVNYDCNGKHNPILTREELAFWSETSEMIARHFEGYQPFEGSARYQNATRVAGEVIADSEGMKVALLIAKEYDNFDYDKFFRSYAAVWSKLTTKADVNDRILNNEHPLHCIRINYNVRQTDEFIKTYGVKPGDGMYLDPSERINIW